MPRVFDSANNPIDFCLKHMPPEEVAKRRYGNVGNGPDGRGNCFGHDCEHPDYGGDNYRCHSCKKVLTSEDN